MAVLEVQDFNVTYMTKRRPPFRAVIDANLSVGEGEVVGLVGESGSGKSTLGNAAIRLLDPPGTITGGKVLLQGQGHHPPARGAAAGIAVERHLDRVPGQHGLAQSGHQHRAAVSRHHPGPTPARATARPGDVPKHALEMVSIDPQFLRFFAHELSGGMKQRVCLALALVLEPDFVLLDEPTTGLDVVVQRSILQNLKQLQKEQGFSVLMISHDLGAIMEVADRVAVMYNGEIVDTQPAKQLLETPKHAYSQMLLDSYRELWLDPGEEGSSDLARQVWHAVRTHLRSRSRW